MPKRPADAIPLYTPADEQEIIEWSRYHSDAVILFVNRRLWVVRDTVAADLEDEEGSDPLVPVWYQLEFLDIVGESRLETLIMDRIKTALTTAAPSALLTRIRRRLLQIAGPRVAWMVKGFHLQPNGVSPRWTTWKELLSI